MRANDRRHWVDEAEKAGVVADSMEVRKALMTLVKAGEITLTEVQKELRKIKRNAKANGKVTRNQAFHGRRPPKEAP